MPSHCMVIGCGSKSGKDINLSFYRLPSVNTKGNKVCNQSKERREKWINALKRSDITESKIKYGRICSKHFLTGKPAKLSDVTHPDWLPNECMGYTDSPEVKNVDECNQYEIRPEVIWLPMHT